MEINLAQNNVLRGFNVGNVGNANRKINGAGFGQLTVGKTGAGEQDVALSGTGMALFLQNGTIGANSSFNSVASTGSTAQGMLLTQITAGTLNFVGVTISGSTGACIDVNGSSADINFGATDVSAGTDGVSLAEQPGRHALLRHTHDHGRLRHQASATSIRTVPARASAAVSSRSRARPRSRTPAGNGIDIDALERQPLVCRDDREQECDRQHRRRSDQQRDAHHRLLDPRCHQDERLRLNTNNSGTVNAGGSRLTQNGAGAAGLYNQHRARPELRQRLINRRRERPHLSGGSGTFDSGTTNLQNNTGIGILMSSSAVAANFGNTTVNGSAGDAVDLSAIPATSPSQPWTCRPTQTSAASMP